MKIRLRVRELFRHLYVMIFGSFVSKKVIHDAEMMLCNPLGHPLLNIRCKKCEYTLNYSRNGLTISISVYDANFYPHAYRLSHKGGLIIIRDDPGDHRYVSSDIGNVHIYENKKRTLLFRGKMDEAHQWIDIIAGAPVITVSSDFEDAFAERPDGDPIADTERFIKAEDPPGAVRYVPLITYSGKGYIHA